MAEEKSYIEILVEMKTAHYKAYGNLIKILNQDLEEEEGNGDDKGKLKLNEDKIKSYADGIYKASTTLDLIKDKIKKLEIEIEALDKKNNDSPDSEEKKEEPKKGHGMNEYLE